MKYGFYSRYDSAWNKHDFQFKVTYKFDEAGKPPLSQYARYEIGLGLICLQPSFDSTPYEGEYYEYFQWTIDWDMSYYD